MANKTLCVFDHKQNIECILQYMYFIVKRNLIQECYNNIYDYKMDSKSDSTRKYFFLELEFDPPEHFC